MRKISFASLLILALSSCGITIKNARVCTVAGVIQAGADCAYLLSDQTEEMDYSEFMYFLEPQFATPTVPARGGAFCMSAMDWVQMKSSLEQACRRLGKKCKIEDQNKIKSVNKTLNYLNNKSRQ
jgi:hypothetical protein